MTHKEIYGVPVGQHPLVSHFLKGVFNSRPPAPRYSMTWDDIVLSHIRGMEDNDELSFQLLSHKLVMLMALTNADRCSDMAALDLTYQSYQRNEAQFCYSGSKKTKHSGPPTEAFYPTFAAVPKLCPVWTLQCYERRSEKLRTNSNSTLQKALFISIWRPHKPVKLATIGHWLKRIMKSAGIDTDSFFCTFYSWCIYIKGPGSGSFYGIYFEGSQLKFHLHALPFLPQAN